MSFLSKLMPGRAVGDAAALYARLVAQARTPVFFTAFGVPDTVGGRFDMIALHAYVAMRRLRELGGGPAAKLSQALFDTMFADMDRNLREMNVSDLRVGRKVKDLAKSFYGRIKAYDEGLAGGPDALAAALARNLYADGPTVEAAQISLMADYLQRAIARSRTWDLAHIGRAEIEFPSAVS